MTAATDAVGAAAIVRLLDALDRPPRRPRFEQPWTREDHEAARAEIRAEQRVHGGR